MPTHCRDAQADRRVPRATGGWAQEVVELGGIEPVWGHIWRVFEGWRCLRSRANQSIVVISRVALSREI